MIAEEEHLKWWEQNSDSLQFGVIKSYIDDIRNGSLSEYQQNEIKRLLRDTPQTLYFIGRASFLIEGKEFCKKSLNREKEILKDVLNYKSYCQELIRLLETPFPKADINMTHNQSVLALLLCDNREYIPPRFKEKGYVDISALLSVLRKIVNNCKWEDDNPVMDLVKSRKGNRKNLALEDFSNELVSDFYATYNRLPTLSDKSSDYEAFGHIFDAYEYKADDNRLKILKTIVKNIRDQY